MSLAYLKKKHATDKLRKEKEDKELKLAQEAALQAQRDEERAARRVADALEAKRRDDLWRATAYERELAAKVERRGGVYCGHGTHGKHGLHRSMRAARRLTPMEALMVLALMPLPR
jgi:hypothetical protein